MSLNFILDFEKEIKAMNKPNAFDTIRERHHSAARLFAAGHSSSEIAHLMGTSEAQLTRQANDPSFRDLVSRYRSASAAQDTVARFQVCALAA